MKTPYDRLVKIETDDQDGHHTHTWSNPFKYFILWNQKGLGLGMWQWGCGLY